MTKIEFESGKFYNSDCFDVMAELEAGSVDMVLADLPYGTTSCAWDAVLPFSQLWDSYWRLSKAAAPILLFGAEPFASTLRLSCFDNYRYDWYWRKTMPTGVAFAKFQPMRVVETISTFYKSRPIYNKQPTKTIISDRRINEGRPNGSGSNGNSSHIKMKSRTQVQTENVSPRNLLEFKSIGNAGGHKIHPTQKPHELFEYLIRTYTNEGQLVLDNTAGSGTTAIAAMNAGRRWICIEKDPVYYERAIERIRAHEIALKNREPILETA